MRSFTDLGEALRFLSAAVEGGNWGRLAEACREAVPPEWVLDRLRERNAATPLVRLYAGREFPADAQKFKLGGHGKKFGHIHIEFVRSDAGWELQRIWMCR
jgi:hypothetical protein